MKKNLARYILSSIIVIGFFSLMFVLIRFAIPVDNRDIMNIVVGALIGAFLTVVNYEFGSSVGSKEKTDMLNKS